MEIQTQLPTEVIKIFDEISNYTSTKYTKILVQNTKLGNNITDFVYTCIYCNYNTYTKGFNFSELSLIISRREYIIYGMELQNIESFLVIRIYKRQ